MGRMESKKGRENSASGHPSKPSDGSRNKNGHSSSINGEKAPHKPSPSSSKSAPSDSKSKTAKPASEPSDPSNPSSSLPPSSSRLMRNLAEKMRRDKLNTYISELSTLVPIVAMATKRMDKTSVLRLSANFLRIHLSLKQYKKKSKQNLVPKDLESNLSTMLLDSLEGFILMVTSSGKIVYVSESVEKLLGHSQLDLMGQSLYNICHNGDQELLKHHLQPSSSFSQGDQNGLQDMPSSPSFIGNLPEHSFGGLSSGERRSFHVRMTERTLARGDPARYITVHLMGLLRPPEGKKEDGNTKALSKLKKDSSTIPAGEEHLLICVARPFRSKGITELSMMEAVQDEYITRHLPDGRILYSDHRIAFVAGYLAEEVIGLSGFKFIHKDDLPWATVANKQMFSNVEGQGFTVLRLMSKTGNLIHLRIRGFLEFNKTTQKVETFVCISTLLSNEEGNRELDKERERITPFITFQQVTTSANSSSNALMAPTSSPSQPNSNQVVALPQNSPAIEGLENPVVVPSSVSPVPPLKASFNSLVTSITTAPSGNSSINSESVEECLGSNTDSEPDQLLSANSVEILTVSNGLISEIISARESKYDMLTPQSISSPSQPSSAESNDINLSELIGGNPAHPEFITVSKPEMVTPADALEFTTVTLDSLPRLKRSISDVDELVVTSSAKKPAVISSAFVVPFSRRSSQLGPKWKTDASTTIVFDQHNNNG